MRNPELLINQRNLFDAIISSSVFLTEALELERLAYENYDQDRLDYVDIVEPLGKVVTAFLSGNEVPIQALFNVLETNVNRCDAEAKNYILAGILEPLENRTISLGLDPKTCYKLMMKQQIIPLWNNLSQY